MRMKAELGTAQVMQTSRLSNASVRGKPNSSSSNGAYARKRRTSAAITIVWLRGIDHNRRFHAAQSLKMLIL